MSANEQHDEAKLQEVVEDEVASNMSGSCDIFAVRGEEMPYVNNLKEESHEPIERSHEGIQGERCRVRGIVSPDGISPALFIIVGNFKGVVDAGQDRQEPCDDGEDLVSPDGPHRMRLASQEGVCIRERHLGILWGVEMVGKKVKIPAADAAARRETRVHFLLPTSYFLAGCSKSKMRKLQGAGAVWPSLEAEAGSPSGVDCGRGKGRGKGGGGSKVRGFEGLRQRKESDRLIQGGRFL